MPTQPNTPLPGKFLPSSPPETPTPQPVPEAPHRELPEIIPDQPDEDNPGSAPDEIP
ncbi:MAG: hypothetical protein J0I80_07980 [Sphingomonas sp.]|mgnify:FL=1|nr:hypothetical protein [Sphingomonas sp.]